MIQAATIPAEAIQHLSQMAALYGYQLVPAAPLVVSITPDTFNIKRLIKKKTWTKQDAAAAADYCTKYGLTKIPGLIQALKYSS